ncbi:hypothetical protein WFP14_01020 [Yersinia proxima]|uniref:Uncharacterized protein n=1 Tax=Yersinia proxima TaxID=2890316 RepID=A0ABW9ETH6_9GAMM
MTQHHFALPSNRRALRLAIQLALGLTTLSAPAWAEDYFHPGSVAAVIFSTCAAG